MLSRGKLMVQMCMKETEQKSNKKSNETKCTGKIFMKLKNILYDKKRDYF